MFERVLSVKYINKKDSFLYLSSKLKFIKTGTCVRIRYGNDTVSYFSVGSPVVNLDENSIGINALLGQTLGLKENDFIVLSEIPRLPTINTFKVTPFGEDYEVLEAFAENVQSTLLNQIRVVNCHQPIVIWIGNNINVKVNIDMVKPVTPGIIDFLTEVIVDSDKNPMNSVQKNLRKDFSKIKSIKIYNELNFINNIEKFYNQDEDLIFRLISLTKLPFYNNLNKNCHLFNVFAFKTIFYNYNFAKENSVETPIYCCLKLLTNDVFTQKNLYVRLIFIEDCLENTEHAKLSSCLFIDEQIFDIFDSEFGCKVSLKVVDKKPLTVNEINIFANKNPVHVKNIFKNYLNEYKGEIILNSDVAFKIKNDLVCKLKFSPVEATFCIVNADLLKNVTKIYTVHRETVNLNKKEKPRKTIENLIENLSNYEHIVKEIAANFEENSKFWVNTLITGNPGSGKSTLLKNISEKLQSFPILLHVKIIFCKNLKGKTMDSLQKAFSTVFSELILHQPSVLLLDDLNVLCENVRSEETSPNVIYVNRIAEMLHNFFTSMCLLNKIGIIATAESVSKLHKNIYSSRGSHLFKHFCEISSLEKVDRYNFIKNLFKNYQIGNVNFDDLSVKTEGFAVQDLVDFCNKTLFEAYKNDESENDKEICITQGYCDAALKNTCVLSLQNVQFHSPGDRDFSDIGGLGNVKEVLVRSLMWPAQYPGIFAKAPLRLQSGLLMYGPPGTGKTIVAAAAARHCGLRLISIKGPELLSKYIGASEQAVRDVFQKAQSARPCILFFDEFDSLAPRRGHDNTGVTDRVVNQLLTQLDGVESLSGVCVLAATSRPDLLDPALLRPGRIDRQVLCPLPDQKSRLDILKILSKKIRLDPGVDWGSIASRTGGYSGADLQSLVYTAQLGTFDGLNDCEKMSPSKITQNDIEQALTKTRPSLTAKEKLKYDLIYKKFQGGIVDDFRPGSKATLA